MLFTRPLKSSGGLGSRRRSAAKAFAFGIAAATVISACGSGAASASSTSSSGGPITFADLAPFTGVDAALGPIYLTSCYAATTAINKAGGINGHQVNCKAVDTRGDPADAVPATRQMFATTPNLSLVIGVTSDEAATVVPIINANKMVVFAMTGQSEFDHTHFPYFYRLVAPDLEESYAMVAIAQEKHYNKIALAFGNDIGSQTFVNPAISAIKKAGLSLVANETLDLNATTFRTEAQAIVNAHPDVIMTEALGSAEASFLSEVKQLNGGKMIPIIGTSATIDPSWFASVSAAVGASTLAQNYLADNQSVLTSGPAYQNYYNAMVAVKSKMPKGGDLSTFLTAPGAVHLYDGMNIAALAMVKAHSTKPSVYQKYVASIGDGGKGAVLVHSFAQGVKELKAGKKIQFEGPGGITKFDSYHDSLGIFQIDSYSANGQVNVVGNLTNAQLRALS
jgi:branched-chain amino acid transport system substrate-binding protein